MQMTENEIVGKFKRAGNKKEQIKILAELNACDEETIMQILRQNGISNTEYETGAKKTKRKAVKDKEEKKTEIKESEDSPKNREILEDMVEEPVLNKDEEQQVNKALSIPMPVRKACEERVAMLTEKVIEIEKEREIIQDYLNGVI